MPDIGQLRKSRPCYIYLIPKSKWPKGKVITMPFMDGAFYVDTDKSGRVLGIEVLDAYEVEVEGESK